MHHIITTNLMQRCGCAAHVAARCSHCTDSFLRARAAVSTRRLLSFEYSIDSEQLGSWLQLKAAQRARARSGSLHRGRVCVMAVWDAALWPGARCRRAYERHAHSLCIVPSYL